jgi:hypothetical protein
VELSQKQELRNLIWNVVAEMFAMDATQTSNGSVLVQAQTYTVATVPSAVTYPRALIYVSNETGGATIAFSDGTNWRRVQDRAIIA